MTIYWSRTQTLHRILYVGVSSSIELMGTTITSVQSRLVAQPKLPQILLIPRTSHWATQYAVVCCADSTAACAAAGLEMCTWLDF